VGVPSPATWAAASIVDDADLNLEIRDSINFLLAPPRVSAYHTAGTTLTDGVWTLLSLGGELYDTYSVAGHDTVTNNSRVFARETGLYTIQCQIRTSDLSGTICQFQVRQNAAGSSTGGTRLFLTSQNGAGGGQVTELGRERDYPLTAGDYVELFILCDTGANPNATMGAGADATYLQIRWASKQ
jgi:hypothetical protein